MASRKNANPATPKPQSLGTRVGRLLNKLDQLTEAEDAALLDAPEAIRHEFAVKRGKAKSRAGADVLEKLGMDASEDTDIKAFDDA